MPNNSQATENGTAVSENKGWFRSLFSSLASPSYVAVRRQLLITFIVSLIASVVALGGAYLRISEDTRDRELTLLRHMQLQVAGKAEALINWRRQLLGKGDYIAQSDMIRMFCSEMRLPESENEKLREALMGQRPYVDIVLKSLVNQHNLKDAALFDKEGFSYTENPPLSPDNRDSNLHSAPIQQVVKSGLSVILPFVKHGTEYFGSVYRPVFSLTSGEMKEEVVGVLYYRFPLDQELLALLESSEANPLKGSVYLVQKLGDNQVQVIGAKGVIAADFSLSWDDIVKLTTPASNGDKLASHRYEQGLVETEESYLTSRLIHGNELALVQEYPARKFSQDLKSVREKVLMKTVLVVILLISSLLLLQWLLRIRYLRRRLRLQEQTITALAAAVASQDPHLAEHHERLAATALQLGRKLDLSVNERTTLYYAAQLAATTKVSVPRDILTKPEALTAEERELLKASITHTLTLLSHFDFDLPVIPVIQQMNERMDGSGYPQKLKGSEITYLARILGAADSYLALTSERSYRPAMAPQEALQLMEQQANAFDANVLKALRNLSAAD
jgi:HD-GYP domain-containing protein (c-di-GMP phosphodiesterase class II)